MARLPTFEQLGEAKPHPATGVVGYQPTSGQEEAPGAAAAKFGEIVQNEAFKQQEMLNTTRAEDAWNQYKNAAIDYSLGNDGFTKKKGGAAVNGNLYHTYTTQLSQARQAIEQNLGDEDVRRKFKERANVTDIQFKDQLLRHYASERVDYEKQTFNGTMAAGVSLISAQPENQNIFETALANVTRRALALAEFQGVTDKDSLEKIKADVKDTLITKRIDSLLAANPVAAEATYRLVKDEINNPELKLQLQAKTSEAGQIIDVAMVAKKEIANIRESVQGSVFRPGTRDKELVAVNAALAKDPANPELLQAKYVIEGARESDEQPTNGLPSSRQVAAELPLALSRIEKIATEKYGPDPYNPQRARFVRMLDSEFKRLNSEDVRQIQAIENVALDNLMNAALGPVAGMSVEGGGMVKTASGEMVSKGGLVRVTSLPALLSIPGMMENYQRLSATGKKAVEAMITTAANQSERGDPALMNAMRNRLYLPAGDPNKINTWTEVMTDPRVQAGTLNPTQLNYLRADYERSQTEDGRSYTSLKKMGEHVVRAGLQATVPEWDKLMGGVERTKAELAQLMWAQNADTVVAKYNKENKDIRPLFDPQSKESLVTPQEIQRWRDAAGVLTPAHSLNAAATAKATAEAAPITLDAKNPNSTFNSLNPGARYYAPMDFTRPDGTKVKKGDILVKGGAAPTAAAPAAAATIKSAMPVLEEGTAMERRRLSAEERQARDDERERQIRVAMSAIPKQAGKAIVAGVEATGAGVRTVAGLPAKAGEAIAGAIPLMPTDVERAVSSFRNLITAGRYTPASVDIIKQAMDSGMLNADEQAKAAAMMQAIAKRGKR